MHPPIEDWDAAYVQTLATPEESLELEKKASAKLDLSTGPSKREALAELAKQVCAFSNSSRGFLVYGIDDKKGKLDQGVPIMEPSGHHLLKSWVEQQIPNLVSPAIHACQARHIHVPDSHTPDHGVLVVEIPLSDRRPHWVCIGSA
jgi:predicted HTH transcriptional regulator